MIIELPVMNVRAEQVGSLLRPTGLLQARAAQVPEPELRAAEDRAIAEALERQRAIGIDVLADGEMRRASWLTDMADAVEGFVPDKVLLDWKGPGGGSEGGAQEPAKGASGKKADQPPT